MHNVLIFLLVNPRLSARERRSCYSRLSAWLHTRDLARNEEFSEIAVINIFFTVLKTKTQLSVGGGGSCGENFEISHAIDM